MCDNVMNQLIKNGLCTGCGICVSESKNEKMAMAFNKYGFWEPINVSTLDISCIKVCPFNPAPEPFVKDEDVIATEFFHTAKNIHHRIGRFENTYVGYSPEYRNTSSSGGIATFIFKKLLEEKIVDHLFIVTKKNGRYEYQFFNNVDDIDKISKTRYYPVTMQGFFEKLSGIVGKVAVSGVACFVKAIRLKQMYYPEYKDKIPFVLGLICGGIKSTFFSDYLALSSGANVNYQYPEFRVKDFSSTANDYSFRCTSVDDNETFQIKMKTVGDMWGTGYFKSNACDFCTDVTTELADISVGDAWLPEFVHDGAGNSVVITRSELAEDIIQKAIFNKEIEANIVSHELVIRSQRGSFVHRQDAIKFRTALSMFKNKPHLRQKYGSFFISPLQMSVQICRRITRAKSLKIWSSCKSPIKFNSKMKKYRTLLKIFTKLDHFFRK